MAPIVPAAVRCAFVAMESVRDMRESGLTALDFRVN
jgi:hypothetical protein